VLWRGCSAPVPPVCGARRARDRDIRWCGVLVQMVFVALSWPCCFTEIWPVGVLILLAMTFAAAADRLAPRPGHKGFAAALPSMRSPLASGVVIAGMLATGTLTADIAVLLLFLSADDHRQQQ